MRNVLVIFLVAMALGSASGCVQMPTESQGVADIRPQISFIAEAKHRDAIVYVNNAAVGKVGDYLDGRAALRVLPGTHEVRIVHGTQVLLQERFYVADGVSRSFLVR